MGSWSWCFTNSPHNSMRSWCWGPLDSFSGSSDLTRLQKDPQRFWFRFLSNADAVGHVLRPVKQQDSCTTYKEVKGTWSRGQVGGCSLDDQRLPPPSSQERALMVGKRSLIWGGKVRTWWSSWSVCKVIRWELGGGWKHTFWRKEKIVFLCGEC